MTRSNRSVLAVVAGCLLLSACSSDTDDDPVTLPTTTSLTTSATPATSAPPSAGEQPTPTTSLNLPDVHVDSVDAFVEDFFTSLNDAKSSGDFTGFDASYLAQCSGCIAFRQEIQSWLEGGATVEGGDWLILQQSSSQLGGQRATFNALAYRTDGVRTLPNGQIEPLPATEVRFVGGGVVADEPWLMEDIGSTDVPR